MKEVKIPRWYWKRATMPSTREHDTSDVVMCSELKRGWKNDKMEDVKRKNRWKNSSATSNIWCKEVEKSPEIK